MLLLDGSATPAVKTGMSAFITALTEGITSDILWAEISKIAPFLIVIFVVAVGYRILRKLMKGGSKLKVNM